jgi:hypothetical protein
VGQLRASKTQAVININVGCHLLSAQLTMRYIIILVLVGLILSCGQRDVKDPVDYYDRFDLANTIDTTRGSYNPKVDSTYIFPADSSDVVAITDTSDYKIKTIVFPVRGKYITAFLETSSRREKVKYRDYKVQVEITDHEGLYVKRIISKYDLPDSILPDPNLYFIRGATFKHFENNEFQFDLRIICYGDDGCFPSNVKYYIHLVDGIRFESYSDTRYDSTHQAPEWDLN